MLGRTGRLLIAATALGLLCLAGCSSDSNGVEQAACQDHVDCERGNFCNLQGVCTQQECSVQGDCEGIGVICLYVEELGASYCSARECQTGAAPGTEGGCELGYSCIGGACVMDSIPDQDTVGADGGGDQDIKETGDDVEEDVVLPVVDTPCTPCDEENPCADGMFCHPIGSDVHYCLPACTVAGDCESGWICYPFTNEVTACAPETFACDAGCLSQGCPDGQTCDQETDSATFGTCIDAVAECESCSFDRQCGPGQRCVRNGGKFCMSECESAADCDQTWAECREVDAGSGIKVCMPQVPDCCGEDCTLIDCDPDCMAPYPICLNGSCVQCQSDADCSGTNETCNGVTHECEGGLCSGSPSTPYELNGACVQCLEDAHCQSGTCDLTTNSCSGNPSDECGGACVAPYPACAVINGVPSCVPCTADEHCDGGGTCDVGTYSCQGGTGDGGCAGDCVVAGCDAMGQGFDLYCDSESGCCLDRAGSCDNVVAFCRTDTGSECKSIFDIFMGGMGGGMPGMPTEGFAGGMCTCDASLDCVLGLPTCTAARCPDGGGCVDMRVLEILAPGSGAMFEDGICTGFSITDIIGNLF